MNFFNKKLLLLVIIMVPKSVSSAAIPAGRVAIEAVVNVARLGVAAVVLLSQKTIQEQIGCFQQQSHQRQGIDHEFLKLMLTNKYGITTASFNDYMAKYIMSVSSRGRGKGAQSVAPIPIILPQEREKSRSVSVGSAPRIEFIKFENTSNGVHHGLQIATTYRCPIQFSATVDATRSQIPASVARRNYELELTRQKIERDPVSREQYKQLVNQNISFLYDFLGLRGHTARLEAQCCINTLHEPEGIPSGNVLMQYVKPQLQRLLLKEGCFLPIDRKEDFAKALEIIAPYMEAVYINEPLGYYQFLQQCKAANIPGTDSLLSRYNKGYSFFESLRSNISLLFTSTSLKSAEIGDSPFLKEFWSFNQLCRNQQFKEAATILDHYDKLYAAEQNDHQRVIRVRKYNALKMVYCDYYGRVYNRYKVRYEYTDDPYYHVAEMLLEKSFGDTRDELLKTVSNTVEARQQKLNNLFQKVGINKEAACPVVRAFSYALIDAQTPEEIIQILSPLAKDHNDSRYAAAYEIFFQNNVPKLITVNNIVKNTVMPQAINLIDNVQAKKLFALCAAYEPKNYHEEYELKQIISYIDSSITIPQLRNEYLFLAEKKYDILRFYENDRLVLKLPDFSKDFFSPDLPVHKQLIISTVSALRKLEEISATNESAKRYYEEIISHVGIALEQLQSNKLENAEFLLKNGIDPFVETYNDQNYQVLFAFSKKKEIANLSSLLEEEKKLEDQMGCGTGLVPEPKRHVECMLPLEREKVKFEGNCLPSKQSGEDHQFECGAFTWEKEKKIDEYQQCNNSKTSSRSFGEFGDNKENDEADKVHEPKKKAAIIPIEQDKAEIESRENEKDSSKLKVKELQTIEFELEKLSEQFKNSIENISKEQALIIDSFIQDLRELIGKYGFNNVKEALKIKMVNGPSLITRKAVILKAFEWLIKSLNKINSNEIYEKFKYDPAHNGKVKVGNIEEAIAGIACIEQKLLNKIIRSNHPAEEFIEQDKMIRWDVKTARSYSLFENQRIFNCEKFKDSLKTSLRDDENIIIQITDLNESDLNDLYCSLSKEFSKRELEKMIIIHAENPLKSKSVKDLLAYLGK